MQPKSESTAATKHHSPVSEVVMTNVPDALDAVLSILQKYEGREITIKSHVDVFAGDWDKITERGVEVKFAWFVPRDRIWIEVA